MRWNIYAEEKNITACNHIIDCRALDFAHVFEPGDNIIEFTPKEAGDVRYYCGMGMMYGIIHITE